MIIVEGADNAGKSTFIEQMLALDPDLSLLKRKRFNKHNGETIGSSYLEALIPPTGGDRRSHTRTIADRFLASECIYGALYRGGCRMSEREHFLIKSTLISYGAIVVHCDPGDEAILKTWKDRPQMYDKEPLALAHAYRKRLSRIFHPIPVIVYDWTQPDAERARQVLSKLHHDLLLEYDDNLDPLSSCLTV